MEISWNSNDQNPTSEFLLTVAVKMLTTSSHTRRRNSLKLELLSWLIVSSREGSSTCTRAVLCSSHASLTARSSVGFICMRFIRMWGPGKWRVGASYRLSWLYLWTVQNGTFCLPLQFCMGWPVLTSSHIFHVSINYMFSTKRELTHLCT